MDDAVRKILDAAVRAPSGENAQPWHFVVRGRGRDTEIEVRLSKDRERSLYSWGDRASYVALGAAIENIHIFAPSVGFSSHIHSLPVHQDLELVARIRLTMTNGQKDPLSDHIFDRVTNRKPYSNSNLTQQQRISLQDEARRSGGDLRFADSKEDRSHLAAVGSTNEMLMLANPIMHEFFFSHVNWTKEEDMRKMVGFYIDTLELPPPAKVGFRVMSSWSRAKFLNMLGFNKIAASQNAAIYEQCGAFGAIVSKSESPLSAIEAGRTLQRIWLEATRLGLSVQPMAGVLFLALAVKAGETKHFTKDQISRIQECDATVRDTFRLNDSLTYFMFRIGLGPAPSAHSIRRPVDSVVTEIT